MPIDTARSRVPSRRSPGRGRRPGGATPPAHVGRPRARPDRGTPAHRTRLGTPRRKRGIRDSPRSVRRSHVGIRRALACPGRRADFGLYCTDVREPDDGHPVDLLLRIDRQVGDQRNTAQGPDGEHGPPVPDVGERRDARQSLAPVDANRAGPARSVMACVTEDERGIRFGPGPLDHVEDRVGRPLHGYLDLLVPDPAPTLPGRPPQPQSESVRHRSTADTSGAEPRGSDTLQ